MRRLVLLCLLATPAVAGDPEPAPQGEPRVDEARKPRNRLASESSPYLLQHASNPVDWHPWGDAAFEKARREGKPVFLSIGYSTCHWCHVMERESFEDEAIAAFLNEHFVSVKVDREERPDVDAVYMAATQATTGSGGWPMSCFLDHERRPFFCGTYFPPDDRYGRAGFPTLLRRIHDVWTTRRADVEQSAAEIARIVREGSGPGPRADIAPEAVSRAAEQLAASCDAKHGGYGPAPKFPRAFMMSFVLERAAAGVPAASAARDGAVAALRAIVRGGLHDHVGGGFHRYSTDREWLVPHFEKMLYDQAFAVQALTDAWLATGDAEFRDAARAACEYVLRDLRDAEGGFHSAEDADSEGHEGKFYVWTVAELTAVLGESGAADACALWAARPEGNFRDEASGARSGANILHLPGPDGTVPAELSAKADAMRAKLFAARAGRVRPHLDDKVLADWNGMMIGALARAGSVFGEPRWVAEAVRAADFVLRSMRTKDGALLHRWRRGSAAVPAFLEDHAFLALGLADLYEATFDPRHLAAARDLCRTIVRDFASPDGTFATSCRRGETLIASPRDIYDGAIPSGNSAAALALLRVASATGDEDLAAAGRRCVEAWMTTIERYPAGHAFMLRALAWAAGPVREIVISGDPAAAETRAMVAETRRRLLPATVVLVRAPGEAGRALAAVAPFTDAMTDSDGRPTARVCEGRTCRAPVTSAAELAAILAR